jgi:hypothetical protein
MIIGCDKQRMFVNNDYCQLFSLIGNAKVVNAAFVRKQLLIKSVLQFILDSKTTLVRGKLQ